jgi:hypothetical protein
MMMGTTTSTLSTKRIVIYLRLWKTRRIISFGARDFGNCREKHKQNATMKFLSWKYGRFVVYLNRYGFRQFPSVRFKL